MSFAPRALTAAAALAALLCLCTAETEARQRRRARRAAPAKQQPPPPAETPQAELARLRDQLVQATRDYQASLEPLLALREAEVKRADERVTKTTELFRAGLVSKRDLENDELAAEQARARVALVRGQMKNADVQIAETLVEAEAEEAAAKALAREQARARALGRAAAATVATTAYIRFGGTRSWTLSEAGAVGQFFARSFGRQLPVSSFGQSPVHDRWGYAHHNAMDVGLSPDSVEGRALMEYLRSNGVPFTAFRHAIPGTATGPHIHVGRPSHKITPR
ncbi:MAG TPA: TolC family protein [Pyrinomonadaceae bacterium]|jgi:hypothetical protein